MQASQCLSWQSLDKVRRWAFVNIWYLQEHNAKSLPCCELVYCWYVLPCFECISGSHMNRWKKREVCDMTTSPSVSQGGAVGTYY